MLTREQKGRSGEILGLLTHRALVQQLWQPSSAACQGCPLPVFLYLKKERKALQRERGCLAKLIKAAQAGLWELLGFQSFFFVSSFPASLPTSCPGIWTSPRPLTLCRHRPNYSSPLLLRLRANYCSANLPSGLISKFIQEAEQLGGSAVNTTYPAGSKAAPELSEEN